MNRKEKIEKEFKSYAKKVFKYIPKFVQIQLAKLYLVMIDKNVPSYKKAIAIGALTYFIMPIDGIPDILGPMGFSDDIAVVAAAIGVLTDLKTDEQANEFIKEYLES